MVTKMVTRAHLLLPFVLAVIGPSCKAVTQYQRVIANV
jgi:hypothetical protein